MKEIYIKEHSSFCLPHKDKWCCVRTFCELNISKFLFYHNTEFYLINYHSCLDSGDKYDFYITLLNSLFKAKKINDYEITRGYNIKYDLKEMRLRDGIIGKIFNEVNYLYMDAAGKMYGLVTQISITEYFNLDNKKLKRNFKEARKILSKRNEQYLLSELDELYFINIIDIPTVEIIKSVDYLIKKFNKKIRQNETS